MKFKESYKIDEIREAQIVQILSQVGAITIEEAREMVGLDPEMPKGTILNSIGDDKAINEAKDERRQQGKEDLPTDHTDNKVK